MAHQASQARAPAVASSSSPVLAVDTNHDAPRCPRVIAAAAAAEDEEEEDYDIIGRALLTKRDSIRRTSTRKKEVVIMDGPPWRIFPAREM